MKRTTTPLLCAGLVAAGWASGAKAEGPDPVFEKPGPVTMAELAKRTTEGVSALEVNDYAPGHYTGALTPSPPHADLNARKAIVIFWKDHPHRFIFSHEASYCPLMELTNGAAMCNQFFEGNLGDAELLNNMGRKEKNSFVDIIQNGPQRVWVRWTYFAVNMNDDTKPRLRGTEDYFAYPNGLVLRRMTYESLMPNEIVGYSTTPVELFGVAPAGSLIKDLFPRDSERGDHLTHTVLDLYGDGRYDIYWDDKGGVRRRGDDSTLAALSQSPGCALVLPFRERLLFAVLGNAGGFPREKHQIIDQCTPGAEGGLGWGTGLWDHWPIGWLNSQGNAWKPGSPYAYSFGSVGPGFVPDAKRIKSFWKDYSEYCKDMELNRWTERRVFYVLLGAARTWDDIRRIGRDWLDQGAACARPETIAGLRTTGATATFGGKPICDIRFNSSHLQIPDSRGDEWAPTWADDGNLYTGNDDGNSFGGIAGRNIAFGKLTGDDPYHLKGVTLNAMDYGAEGQLGADRASWKTMNSYCVDGVMYMFVTRCSYPKVISDPNNRCPFRNSSIIKSTDRGLTWTRSSTENYGHPMFPGGRFGAPYFVWYGQDGAASVDNANHYVYAISNDGYFSEGSNYILGRVLRSNLPSLNAADWQFYTGGDGMSNDNWTTNMNKATFILQDALNCSMTGMTYIPGLGRYVMVVWHYTLRDITVDTKTINEYYEAPKPWGPWTKFKTVDTGSLGWYCPVIGQKFQTRVNENEVNCFLYVTGNYSIPSLYRFTYIPVTLKIKDSGF